MVQSLAHPSHRSVVTCLATLLRLLLSVLSASPSAVPLVLSPIKHPAAPTTAQPASSCVLPAAYLTFCFSLYSSTSLPFCCTPSSTRIHIHSFNIQHFSSFFIPLTSLNACPLPHLPKPAAAHRLFILHVTQHKGKEHLSEPLWCDLLMQHSSLMITLN